VGDGGAPVVADRCQTDGRVQGAVQAEGAPLSYRVLVRNRTQADSAARPARNGGLLPFERGPRAPNEKRFRDFLQDVPCVICGVLMKPYTTPLNVFCVECKMDVEEVDEIPAPSDTKATPRLRRASPALRRSEVERIFVRPAITELLVKKAAPGVLQ
jgi:hypothetical protein